MSQRGPGDSLSRNQRRHLRRAGVLDAVVAGPPAPEFSEDVAPPVAPDASSCPSRLCLWGGHGCGDWRRRRRRRRRRKRKRKGRD